jgi:HK97 family phage major capsid protein
MELHELAKKIDEENKAWEAFKAELKKGRDADQEKLGRLETAMNTALDAKATHDKELKAAKDRADELEKKLNRLELGGAGRGEQDPNKERKMAFDRFLRVGQSRLTDLERKALTMSDDTASAYLATTEYVREIIKDEVLFSPVRPLIRIRPTTKRGTSQPKRTQTAAARWVAETGDARVETQNPAYGLDEIPAHELVAVAYISMADLEDSDFDLQGEIRQEFSEQFGVSEGAAVINGTGVGKPFGILDASQGITKVKSGVSAKIADTDGTADGLIDLVHDLKTVYAARATFGFNRKTLGALRKLKDGQKRYIFAPSPAVGMPSTILDSPFVELPDMPDPAADNTPIAYGDWRRAYTGVDRVQLSIVRDDFTQAENGLVKFVGRRRFGGKVVLAAAMRLLVCSA